MRCFYVSLLAFIILLGCQEKKSQQTTFKAKSATKQASTKRFSLLPANQTGINFNNALRQDSIRNTLYYTYLFNGAGVAIGDINNDGKPDIYFAGNQVADRLYLNKGNFQFEDITKTAGVTGWLPDRPYTWSSGVTMVDINQDGWLDIYVCQGGPFGSEEDRANILYINNGDLTFTDKAPEYGIDDGSYSTQAVFFDADKDKDLDLFVLNHSTLFDYNLAEVNHIIKDEKVLHGISNKFFRNEGNNTFREITKKAGVLGYGYGLGVVASDFNHDGWTDLYVSNDFSTPDFMYINQKNGTFRNEINTKTQHISYYGMGCDIADINNDGYLDIGVVDMTADDHFRSKTLMPSMRVNVFRGLHDHMGYQYQYMFNTLQLNDGKGGFQEVAQYAGVHKTDWSWSILLADLDNDADKDIFVSNGWMQDTKNNDFLEKYRQRKRELGVKKIPASEIMKWVSQIPSQKISNFVYANDGDLKFTKKSQEWGLNQSSFSNGAALGDLDGDGDLDLVVNNINDPAFVYRNNSREQEQNHYLQIQLVGDQYDRLSLNAKVRMDTENGLQVQEHTLTRGYASSNEPILHFGLGDLEAVKSLEVEWLDGTRHLLENLPADQRVIIEKAKANGKSRGKESPVPPAFTQMKKIPGVDYTHLEFPFDEFAKEILLPHVQSQNGPFIATADVDGNGLDDFFIGGAHSQAGHLYCQTQPGKFQEKSSGLWRKEAAFEDMGAVFFDADQDQDLDLYVVSGGGGEMEGKPALLQDRLYLNDGKGNFSRAADALPAIQSSGQVIDVTDIDGDGDLDLFVGGRVVPGRYPSPPKSFLLANEGGKFVDVTSRYSSGLENIGMVTDAKWTDFNQDGKTDLIVVGEWMPVTLFMNDGRQLKKYKEIPGSNGWWNTVEMADLNGDGKMDYIVGNLGKNTKFKASESKPLHVYGNDFDSNGSMDIVLACDYHGRTVPVRGRECTSQQMPFIKEKFKTFSEFASADIVGLYSFEKVDKAIHLEVNEFRSLVLINEGNGNFAKKPLPMEAQLFPVKGILVKDFNGDQHADLLLVGNMYGAEVETIRYDAGKGVYLQGKGDGTFSAIRNVVSGFWAEKDARDICFIRKNGDQEGIIAVTNNNAPIDFFSFQKSPAVIQ